MTIIHTVNTNVIKDYIYIEFLKVLKESKEEHSVSFRKEPGLSCGASSVMRHTTPSEGKLYEK